MRKGVLAATTLLAIVVSCVWPVAAGATSRAQIRTLSNRADLISGGVTLVQIVLPKGVEFANRKLHVHLNGRNVKQVFAVRDDLASRWADRGIIGLVTDLRDGRNVLSVTLPDRRDAELVITNHPIGGPVFAGQQVQPWLCDTAAYGLSKPLDSQCDAKAVITYMYKSSSAGQFEPYDPAKPASDVATTTTDQGATVPYIVRLETGAQDRGIYQTAVLADPTKPWTPWAPQRAWNHKLMVPFGGSCGPDHTQSGPGAATPTGDSFDVASVTVMDDTALSRGFAVTSSGLNTLAQDCNEVVSAEALMMQKEHIGDTLGQIRYTIGEGCSGGSIQQYNIAADYPGLLNGITPMCSFPDDWTPITDGTDCELLLHYFDQTSSELWATPQEGLVEGKEGVGTPCDVWTATLTDALDPSARGSFRLGIYSLPNCGTPPNQIYDPKTNRKGVRCDVQDYQSSLWGFRPQDGFAKRPLDNIGVQYGLEALNSGEITAAQFVDLNSKIGGLSIDDDFIPQRMAMDPGVARIMYRSGRSTDARQLADVPIIDLRGQDNEEVHQSFYSYMTRLRLDQANGTHANQVLWTGAIPLQGTTDFVPAAFLAMDRWLSAIERDRRRRPLARKVIQDKPGDIVDTCWVQGQAITDTTTCRNLSGYYADPRIAAGAPLTDDVRKCQLKPLNRVDYRVSFSDAQWAELQRAFPTGVCDWQLSSAGQQRSIPWMSYTKGPGGNPLGPPPVPIPLSRRCDGQRPPCAKRGSVLLHSRGL